MFFQPGVVYEAESVATALLVLNDANYPGWRAYVDGRFAETLRVNYNLRGAALPAGQHVVQFVYRPKSLMLGVAISLFAIVLLGVGLVVDRKYTVFR